MFQKKAKAEPTVAELVAEQLRECDHEILLVEAEIENHKLTLMKAQCRLTVLHERHQRLTSSDEAFSLAKFNHREANTVGQNA